MFAINAALCRALHCTFSPLSRQKVMYYFFEYEYCIVYVCKISMFVLVNKHTDSPLSCVCALKSVKDAAPPFSKGFELGQPLLFWFWGFFFPSYFLSGLVHVLQPDTLCIWICNILCLDSKIKLHIETEENY